MAAAGEFEEGAETLVATEEEWADLAADTAAEDWGEEEEVKGHRPSAAASTVLRGPAAVEQFQAWLSAVESLVADFTGERHLAVYDADSLFQQVADWVVATNRADQSGLQDAALLYQVFDVIDRYTAAVTTKRLLYVRLFAAYIRNITVDHPARASPTIGTLLRRVIQSDMNPPGREGIIEFMPLRFYSAMRLASFVQTLWEAIDTVYATNIVLRSYLETTVLIVAYHASLPIFGKEGEQKFLDWLAAGSEERFQRNHPGPYRWLTKCKSRLRRCSNTVTTQRIPICDIASPVFWGPVPSDKTCYDIRNLVQQIGQQLTISQSTPPTYPVDRAVIPNAGLRVLRRRASRYGLAIPPTLDTYLATLPKPAPPPPVRSRPPPASARSRLLSGGATLGSVGTRAAPY